MSSTTSTPTTFLSSPRSQRMMVWISGAVLVIGLAIFLGAFLGRGTSQDAHTGGLKSQGTNARPNRNASTENVPASPAARSVARTFLETAVARKNLATAYAITGPALKGIPRAQWVTGNNPVAYYPAGNLKTAPFKVLSSTKSELLLEVGPLVAAKGKKIRPLSFQLGVDRIGHKWLVNYFMSESTIQYPTQQGAGFGGN
jgi:hypothetical protein